MEIEAGMAMSGGMTGQGGAPPECVAGVAVNADDNVGKMGVEI
jgi:hypothetical protein